MEIIVWVCCSCDCHWLCNIVLRPFNLQFNETDRDGDDLTDFFRMTVSFNNLSHDVQTIQMLLFFQVDLNVRL